MFDDMSGRIAALEAALRDSHLARTSLEQQLAESVGAKDELLAMLGHELRNPLSPIVAAVELMRQRTGGSPELDVVERQVTHLVQLVDDLLDISRITRGKVLLDLHPVIVSAVVARAVQLAGPLLEQRRHQVTLDLPAVEIRLEADEQRLSQIIANLLTNAAKYTSPGGTITVRAWRDAGDVSIAVTDSGIGISADMLPRVFDLFVQGHRTSDRGQGGLGIGLALVRNLVAMHHGSVSASSDGLGFGSRFVVRLPAPEQVLAGAPVPVPAPARPAVAQKILVVDDNVDAAVGLGELLEDAGYEIKVAHDAPQALAIIATWTPEVALLDIGLPGIDGYELGAMLREQLGDRTPRMIAMTGYGQDKDRAKSKLAGFAIHLVKPCRLATILAAITGGTDLAPPENAAA